MLLCRPSGNFIYILESVSTHDWVKMCSSKRGWGNSMHSFGAIQSTGYNNIQKTKGAAGEVAEGCQWSWLPCT